MANFGNNFILINKNWEDFKTIASNKSLSIQYDETSELYEIFCIDGPIIYVSHIFKGSMPNNSFVSQSSNDGYKTDFTNNYLSKSNKPVDLNNNIRNRAVNANFRKDNISSTSYFNLIDLSNASGSYKHINGSGIKLLGLHAIGIKSNANDKWVVNVGTILDTSASDITIGWLRQGAMNTRDTNTFQSSITLYPFPLVIDLSVSNGDYIKIADNFIETTTDLNNNSNLEDISGNTSNPEPGDLIIKVQKIVSGNGGGTFLFHYFITYLVE